MALRLTVLCLLLPVCLVAQPKKIALLIGISKYSAEWQAIHGAEDVAEIKSALLKQDFHQADIIVLTNAAATKAAIINALDSLAAKIRPGDMVFILFSGHGQQISDDNGEEPDGYDECLIPYDCPYFHLATPDYDGKKHIRDDELDERLVAIRSRAYPEGQVFVAIDACHSGSSTRAGSGIKNRHRPLQMPLAFTRQVFYGGEKNRMAGESGNVPANVAPMVAFFAALPGQGNEEIMYQNKARGPLSLNLANALEKADGKTSYKRLFEQVELGMSKTSPTQNPYPEGELNRLVFGGQLLGDLEHFLTIKQTEPDFVYLQAGEFYGLFPGTELCFFPPDTWDTIKTKPICKGKVFESDLLVSAVILDKQIEPDKMVGAWAYVKQIKKGGQPLTRIQHLNALKEIQRTEEKSPIRLEFRLKPFECDLEDSGRYIRDLPREKDSVTGIEVRRIDDCFLLEIRNTGNIEVFFTLLDFPVDTALVLVPANNIPIKPGKTWISTENRFLPFYISEPLGPELFKLVASDQPIDLQPAIAIRSGGVLPAPVSTGQKIEIYDYPIVVKPKKN